MMKPPRTTILIFVGAALCVPSAIGQTQIQTMTFDTLPQAQSQGKAPSDTSASDDQHAADTSHSSASGTQDLQKATQNPISSLISVPVQNNSNFGIGPFDRTQNILNIQPVIPIKGK